MWHGNVSTEISTSSGFHQSKIFWVKIKWAKLKLPAKSDRSNCFVLGRNDQDKTWVWSNFEKSDFVKTGRWGRNSNEQQLESHSMSKIDLKVSNNLICFIKEFEFLAAEVLLSSSDRAKFFKKDFLGSMDLWKFKKSEKDLNASHQTASQRSIIGIKKTARCSTFSGLIYSSQIWLSDLRNLKALTSVWTSNLWVRGSDSEIRIASIDREITLETACPA